MEKIKYYYSCMSKQVFLIIIAFLIVIRFILCVQIVTYNVNDYGNMLNLGATSFLYLIYLVVCIFFFIAYKFFIVEFNNDSVTYTNHILRRRKEVDLGEISAAHLTKKGIKLYKENEEKECFYIPFFRLGIISPVGVDSFYKILKQKKILIKKDFDTLPGHGKRWKWVGVLYTCLALLALAPATQTLALVVAIFKNH
ncbi:MAG: hypothetical protein ACK5MV_11450 [Aminipila sp.]